MLFVLTILVKSPIITQKNRCFFFFAFSFRLLNFLVHDFMLSMTDRYHSIWNSGWSPKTIITGLSILENNYLIWYYQFATHSYTRSIYLSTSLLEIYYGRCVTLHSRARLSVQLRELYKQLRTGHTIKLHVYCIWWAH